MSFLYTLDQVSFKKIFGLGVVLALLFTIPTTVVLVQQRTRFGSRAVTLDALPEMDVVTLASPGPVPKEPPKIARISPFLGKVGDVVFVEGVNFGVNPSIKSLKI